MNIQQKDFERYKIVQTARNYIKWCLIFWLVFYVVAPFYTIFATVSLIIKSKDFRKFCFSHAVPILLALCVSVITLVFGHGFGAEMIINIIMPILAVSIVVIVVMGFYNVQKGEIAFFDGIKAEVFELKGKSGVQEFKSEAWQASKKGFEAYCEVLNKYHQEYEANKHIIYTKEEVEKVSRDIVVAVSLFEDKKSAKAMEKRLVQLYKERRYMDMRALYSEYQPKLEAYMQEITAKGENEAVQLEYDGESQFDGKLIQLIGWNVASSLITVFTLGLATPVAICWKERWIKKHTVYQGKRLEFDGTAGQLFGNWIKWLLLSVVTLGIYAWFIPLKMHDWKAKHTHGCGEFKSLGGAFDGKLLQMIVTNILCGLINVFTLGICFPVTICKKQKWIYKHTVLDGRRLVFSGTGASIMGNWIKWIFLSVITLGIYGLFVPIKLEKWKASHTTLKDGIEVAV